MKEASLEPAEIIFDSFTEVVTKNQNAAEVEPDASPDAAEGFNILLIPRIARVKEERSTYPDK